MLYFLFVFLIRILRGPEREPVLWEDADAVVPGVYPGGLGGGLPAGLPRLQALHPATLLPQVRSRLPGGSEQARQVALDFIKNSIFPATLADFFKFLKLFLQQFLFQKPHNSSVLDSVQIVLSFAKFLSFVSLSFEVCWVPKFNTSCFLLYPAHPSLVSWRIQMMHTVLIPVHSFFCLFLCCYNSVFPFHVYIFFHFSSLDHVTLSSILFLKHFSILVSRIHRPTNPPQTLSCDRFYHSFNFYLLPPAIDVAACQFFRSPHTLSGAVFYTGLLRQTVWLVGGKKGPKCISHYCPYLIKLAIYHMHYSSSMSIQVSAVVIYWLSAAERWRI